MTLKSKCDVLKDLFIRQVCECECQIFTARKQSFQRFCFHKHLSFCLQWTVRGRGGMHGRGCMVVGGMHAREMATAVGGKYPTGMHSCLCLPSVNVKAALHLRRTYC